MQLFFVIRHPDTKHAQVFGPFASFGQATDRMEIGKDKLVSVEAMDWTNSLRDGGTLG